MKKYIQNNKIIIGIYVFLILILVMSLLVITYVIFPSNTSYELTDKKDFTVNDRDIASSEEEKQQSLKNTVEEQEEKLNEIYPQSAYTNDILDPKKLSTEPALNQGSNLVLVNKKYVLDENYVPEVYGVDGGYLTEDAMNAYKQMKDVALSDGVNLQIGSSYRSYDEQVEVFNSYLQNDNYENVITYSAYPGTSEHQTGLAIDFIEGSTCDYTQCFENTQSGIWLRENAYKYGFILRFPQGKEDITGYMYEPWHYRYVGQKSAKVIYGNNLTLEEFTYLKGGD